LRHCTVSVASLAVAHKWLAYVRYENGVCISTNTIEGYFATLKRGINGVYHQVGKQHLHRYLSESDFRYNSRKNEGRGTNPAGNQRSWREAANAAGLNRKASAVGSKERKPACKAG